MLPAVVQRSIIHTGDITVRVADVNQAATQAEALADAADGYLGGDDRQIDAGQSTATLTLRVSADRFDATMAAIARLGKEQSRTVSTQDVTSQVIDIAARLRTQQASVDRIRALLAKATTIGEIVSIESELTQREADLESLEAQQAKLGDLTTLSTITVTLLGPQAHLVVAKKTEHKSGFVAGLSRGWHAFLASMAWLLTVLGAVLPFAIGIALVAWLARLLVRRLQARRPTDGARARRTVAAGGVGKLDRTRSRARRGRPAPCAPALGHRARSIARRRRSSVGGCPTSWSRRACHSRAGSSSRAPAPDRTRSLRRPC